MFSVVSLSRLSESERRSQRLKSPTGANKKKVAASKKTKFSPCRPVLSLNDIMSVDICRDASEAKITSAPSGAPCCFSMKVTGGKLRKKAANASRRCGYCGSKDGHNARTCPIKLRHLAKLKAKASRKCSNCGGVGHNARTCVLRGLKVKRRKILQEVSNEKELLKSEHSA